MTYTIPSIVMDVSAIYILSQDRLEKERRKRREGRSKDKILVAITTFRTNSPGCLEGGAGSKTRFCK